MQPTLDLGVKHLALDGLGDVIDHAGGVAALHLGGRASALMAMIGAFPVDVRRALIARVACSPSINGMWMSIRIRS